MGMSAHNHLRDLALAAIAACLLVLWHGQAHAACDSDVVESMVFAMEEPATERTAPCCAVSTASAIAAAKVGAHPTPPLSAAMPGRACFDSSAGALSWVPRLPDQPWRRYCARCARLLR
jgi:hypothetical protein